MSYLNYLNTKISSLKILTDSQRCRRVSSQFCVATKSSGYHGRLVVLQYVRLMDSQSDRFKIFVRKCCWWVIKNQRLLHQMRDARRQSRQKLKNSRRCAILFRHQKKKNKNVEFLAPVAFDSLHKAYGYSHPFEIERGKCRRNNNLNPTDETVFP